MYTFRFMVYSAEEEEPNSYLCLNLGKLELRLKLYPWLVKPRIEYRYSKEYSRIFMETIPKRFGVAYLAADNYLYFCYGIQDETNLSSKSRYKNIGYFLPWRDWTFITHRLLHPNGKVFVDVTNLQYKEEELAIEACPKITYSIEDFDGEIVKATAYLEERIWTKGTGWFKWLRKLNPARVDRRLSIDYSSEIGPRKGSWEGGSEGCSFYVEPGLSCYEAICLKYCLDNISIVAGTYKECG